MLLASVYQDFFIYFELLEDREPIVTEFVFYAFQLKLIKTRVKQIVWGTPSWSSYCLKGVNQYPYSAE